jgi:hypothetical protein
MAFHGSDAPAWLFSFVDLAFLLLIAMTQLAGNPNSPDLGEMVVPRVAAGAATELPTGSPQRWQLRIHPPGEAAPFELLEPGTRPDAAAPRLDGAALRQQLAALHAADVPRPLLAPHADSRSQDLLDAAALLEEQWPSRRRATVAPVFARR